MMPRNASAPPTISTVTYDGGGNVSATVATDGSGSQVTVAVFAGADTTGKVLGSGDTEGTLVPVTLDDPSVLTPGQSYVVAATYGPLAGATWGPIVQFVWQAPTVTSAAYDYEAVEVAWTVSNPTTITAVSAVVWDLDNSRAVVEATVETGSARLVPPTPLLAAGHYQVMVTGVRGVAAGPTESGTLFVTAPVVASATYAEASSDSYSITVNPAAAPPTGASLIGSLVSGGQVVMTATATSGSPVIALVAPLDPSTDSSVTLSYGADFVTGPPSVAAALPLRTPLATLASYDGTKFHVTCVAPAGEPAATGASISVRDPSGTEVGSATAQNGQQADFAPSGTLDTAKLYTVWLAPMLGSVRGAFAAAAPMLVAAPTIAALTCDGDQATVVVSDVASPATGTRLELSDAQGVLSRTAGGMAGGGITLPRVPAGALSVTASAAHDLGAGPPSKAAPVVTVWPALSAITVTDTAAAGTVTAPDSPIKAPATLTVVPVLDGAPGSAVTATEGAFSVPVTTPASSYGLQARVSGANDDGVTLTGPPSPTVPLLVNAPEIATAALTLASGSGAGARVSAEWTLAGPPPAASFRVDLTQGNTSLGSWPVNGTSLDQPVSTSWSVDQSVLLTVTPLGNAGSGRPGKTTFGAGIANLTAAFDGRVVTASWSPAGNDAASAYRLRVSESATSSGKERTIAVSQPGDGLTRSLPLHPMSGAGPFYFVGVDTQHDAAWRIDPLTSVIVPSSAPSVTSVTSSMTDASTGSFTVSWSWPGGDPPYKSSLSGYNVVLRRPGVADAVVGSAPSAGAGSATFTLPPAQPLGSTFAVQAKTSTVTGPLSPAVPVVLEQPAIASVVADAVSILVRLKTPAETVPGRIVALMSGDTVSASAFTREQEITLPNSGVADTAYGVTVQASSDDRRCTGPTSASVPVVLVGPSLSAPVADAGTLTVTVDQPSAGGATITGYAVEVLREGVVVEHFDNVALTSGKLTVPVAPATDGATYAVRARPVAGNATGPAGSVGVLLAAPVVTAAEVGSTNVTAHVEAGPVAGAGVTLEAFLLDGSGNTTTPVAVKDGQALLRLGQSGSYAVVARAVAGSALGPWSAPVPLPLSTPAVRARYTDGTLDLEWTGDATLTYDVAVLDATGALVTATTVRGASARLPLAAVADKAYTANVTSRPGRASGRTGSLALVTDPCAITDATTASDGASVTLDWTAPSGATAYAAVILAGGAEFASVALTDEGDHHGVLTLPSGVPAGASVAIRATAGAATGPLGNAAAILPEVPSGLMISYDGTTLSASWQEVVDPRTDGYVLTIATSGAAPVTQRAAGTSWSGPLTAPTKPTMVTVVAAAGPATGPASAPPRALLTAAPALTSATVADEVATVTWNAVAGAASYLVRVTSSGVETASARTTATTAQVTLPYPGTAHAVTVGALAAGSEGPSTAVALMGARPIVGSAVTDPLTGVTTVNWDPVTGAAGYLLQAFVDGEPSGAPVAATGTSANLPGGATPDAVIEAAVATTGSAGDTTLQGPYGPRFAVVTGQPVLRSVAFDGASTTVRWSPVQGATGYRVSVIDTGGTTIVGQLPAPADADSGRVAVTISDKTLSYEVVVQALRGTSSGPLSSPLALMAPGLFPLTTNGPPRLIPAATLALAPTATTIQLPPLGPAPLTGTTSPIAPVPPDGGQPPFSLAATENTAFPYALTIANGALAFDDASRAGVMWCYNALLTAAETQGASGVGINVLQQAIARAMPQTFDETLYYAYGLRAQKPWIDLRPGMVLRVAFTDYAAMPAKAPDWSTGYGGGAVVDYAIDDFYGAADGVWQVGFDAFLSWLATNMLTTVSPPEPSGSGPGLALSGGADAADLAFMGFRTPFHRLFFPRNLQKPSAPADSQPDHNFAIAATAKYGDLPTAPTPSGTVNVANFRGRAVLRPCIRVWLDGAERVVPVGTTVGNLLDGLGRRPPVTGVHLEDISLRRSRGPVVLDPAAPYVVGADVPVRLDWGALGTFGTLRDALSLPLLHGDRITLG
jgi:hypothetical protein